METCGLDTEAGGACKRIPGHPGDCFDGQFYSPGITPPEFDPWKMGWLMIRSQITLHRVLGLAFVVILFTAQVAFDIVAVANMR